MDNGACSYRRFLMGEESAFDEIMEEHFFNLVFFLNRYLKDLSAAEDLAVDVFSDLIARPNRYNFKVSLKTYLFTLGRSRALDLLRHRKVLEFTDLSEAGEIPDGEPSLEERVLTKELQRAVHRALEQLPEEMRIAVHLVYLENMSYEDTAKVMKKSRKQVDNLLYRAKKELRTLLGEEGEAWL